MLRILNPVKKKKTKQNKNIFSCILQGQNWMVILQFYLGVNVDVDRRVWSRANRLKSKKFKVLTKGNGAKWFLLEHVISSIND